MAGAGRRIARLQVTSRLTWSFSARAGLVRARPRRPGPVSAARRAPAAGLLRAMLRAARPRPPRLPAVLPGAARTRRARHR
ncbi:hypothetical protein [Streptomyces sp. E-15]